MFTAFCLEEASDVTRAASLPDFPFICRNVQKHDAVPSGVIDASIVHSTDCYFTVVMAAGRFSSGANNVAICVVSDVAVQRWTRDPFKRRTVSHNAYPLCRVYVSG